MYACMRPMCLSMRDQQSHTVGVVVGLVVYRLLSYETLYLVFMLGMMRPLPECSIVYKPGMIPYQTGSSPSGTGFPPTRNTKRISTPPKPYVASKHSQTYGTAALCSMTTYGCKHLSSLTSKLSNPNASTIYLLLYSKTGP